MSQYIKEEMDDHADSMFGKEEDLLKISNEAINIADIRKFYVKEEKCDVKEEGVVESFKTEAPSNREIENIMYSDSTQDVKFSIDIKEHNIEHLGIDSNTAGSSKYNTVCTGGSGEKIKLTDTIRMCLHKHTETNNSRNHLLGNVVPNDQMLVNREKQKNNYLESGKIFSSMQSRKYRESSANKNLKKFKCYHCGNCFSRKDNLVRHLNIHKGIKIYHCGECKKRFFRVSELKRHVNVIHKDIRYNCGECEKRFSTMSSLAKHVNVIHKDIRNYNCGECGKRFSKMCHLSSHINMVHKGIRYNCGECEKRFCTVSGLNRHVNMVHKGVGNYNCGECGKRFFVMSHLKGHVNVVHNGIRDYNCGECGKMFSTVSRLKQHINVIHFSNRYNCIVCEKRFSTWSVLNRHANMVHKGIREFDCDEC